jgi:glycosyltransferase involved in cell wall biosynthesis
VEAAADPSIVVTIARLHWKKGHSDGLRAIALLRRSGRKFLWRLIGTGPEEPSLRSAVFDLRLGDCVEFAGPFERAAVGDALRAAAICFQPSTREELGIAAAEAQACGLPVVATCIGGVPEVVEDGTTGLLVAPRDEVAMAAALARLLDDPAEARALGARGRERIRREFDGEAVRGALAAVYRRVLATTARPAAAGA